MSIARASWLTRKAPKVSHFLLYQENRKPLLRKREMARKYLSIFDGEEKVAAEGLSIDLASVYSAFEQVRDGRKKKGKRYPLTLLLTSLMLGKLAGETPVNGHRGLDQRTTRVAALPIELAEAVSDQFNL
jgi:hypothetical protein